jgi:hypothetical protein
VFWIPAAVLAALAVADAATTYIGIAYMGLREGNPLLQFLNKAPWAVLPLGLAQAAAAYIAARLSSRVASRRVRAALARAWAVWVAQRALVVANNVAAIAAHEAHSVLAQAVLASYVAVFAAVIHVLRAAAPRRRRSGPPQPPGGGYAAAGLPAGAPPAATPGGGCRVLEAVDWLGAATLGQIVVATGMDWDDVQRCVYTLEREGRLRSIRVGPVVYYFTNPREAAEVLFAPADPGAPPQGGGGEPGPSAADPSLFSTGPRALC